MDPLINDLISGSVTGLFAGSIIAFFERRTDGRAADRTVVRQMITTIDDFLQARRAGEILPEFRSSPPPEDSGKARVRDGAKILVAVVQRCDDLGKDLSERRARRVAPLVQQARQTITEQIHQTGGSEKIEPLETLRRQLGAESARLAHWL